MKRSRLGLTLIELVVAITIVGLLSLSAAALLESSLNMYSASTGRTNAHHEAQRIMALLRQELRLTSHLFLPNGAEPATEALVISAGVNQDNDFYANNPRFPRVDEDASPDMNNDNDSGLPILSSLLGGILGGLLGGLFTHKNDDDGDGRINEDPKDGIDNDNDGIIDEDWGGDNNSDGYSGIRGADENFDGVVDTANSDNDDEDNRVNEDWLEGMAYYRDSNTKRLLRRSELDATSTIVAENVEGFQVYYEGGTASADPRLRIRLTLPLGDGTNRVFEEYIIPSNVKQRDGRRVL